MWAWLFPPPAVVGPEPRHALVTVLHEGTDSGDVTVEGWITGEQGGHLLVERARIIMPDNTTRPARDRDGVRLEIPLVRVIMRQPISRVSVTQLDAMLAVGP